MKDVIVALCVISVLALAKVGASRESYYNAKIIELQKDVWYVKGELLHIEKMIDVLEGWKPIEVTYKSSATNCEVTEEVELYEYIEPEPQTTTPILIKKKVKKNKP